MSIVKLIVVLAVLGLIGGAVLQLTGVYNFTGVQAKSATADQSDPYTSAEASFFAFKYDDALMGYKKAIEQKPDSPEVPTALFRIARCYDELKKPDQAVAAYKEFLTKYPTDHNAREATKFLSLLGGNMDK